MAKKAKRTSKQVVDDLAEGVGTILGVSDEPVVAAGTAARTEGPILSGLSSLFGGEAASAATESTDVLDEAFDVLGTAAKKAGKSARNNGLMRKRIKDFARAVDPKLGRSIKGHVLDSIVDVARVAGREVKDARSAGIAVAEAVRHSLGDKGEQGLFKAVAQRAGKMAPIGAKAPATVGRIAKGIAKMGGPAKVAGGAIGLAAPFILSGLLSKGSRQKAMQQVENMPMPTGGTGSAKIISLLNQAYPGFDELMVRDPAFASDMVRNFTPPPQESPLPRGAVAFRR